MEELLERMERMVSLLEAAADERGLHISAEAEELSERLELAERKLAEAEAKIAEMSAAAAVTTQRKTLAAGAVATLAKQGISASALEGLEPGRMEAGAVDAALGSLSIEQRFAVKAELLRAGLL